MRKLPARKQRKVLKRGLSFSTICKNCNLSLGHVELLLHMKTPLKLFSIGICVFSLSGCAFTHDVLQAVYDNEADKNCRVSSCDHKRAQFDRRQKKYNERRAKANAVQAKTKKAAEKYISNLNTAEDLRNAENTIPK